MEWTSPSASHGCISPEVKKSHLDITLVVIGSDLIDRVAKELMSASWLLIASYGAFALAPSKIVRQPEMRNKNQAKVAAGLELDEQEREHPNHNNNVKRIAGRKTHTGSTLVVKALNFGRKLAAAYSKLQINHRGMYSIERLHAYKAYCEKTSVARAIAVCVLTPVPSLLAIVLIECIPLRDPSMGWGANYMFWIRFYIGGVLVLIGCSYQATDMADRVKISPLQRLSFKANPGLGKEIKLQLYVLATEGFVSAIYPAFSSVYLKASPTSRAGLVLLLPVIKIIAKNVVAWASSHVDDCIPVKGKVIRIRSPVKLGIPTDAERVLDSLVEHQKTFVTSGARKKLHAASRLGGSGVSRGRPPEPHHILVKQSSTSQAAQKEENVELIEGTLQLLFHCEYHALVDSVPASICTRDPCSAAAESDVAPLTNLSLVITSHADACCEFSRFTYLSAMNDKNLMQVSPAPKLAGPTTDYQHRVKTQRKRTSVAEQHKHVQSTLWIRQVAMIGKGLLLAIVACSGIIVLMGSTYQVTDMVDRVKISLLQSFGMGIVGMGIYIATVILIAYLWVFPVPFGIVLGIGPCFAVFFVVLILTIGINTFKTNPGLGHELKLQFYVLATEAVIAVIYPAFSSVYLRTSSNNRAGLVLLLPMIKLVMKNIVARASSHVEDCIPVIAVFSIEVFNALYVATCMQATKSTLATVVIIFVDAVSGILAFNSLHNRTRALQEQHERSQCFDSKGKRKTTEELIPTVMSASQQLRSFKTKRGRIIRIRSPMKMGLGADAERDLDSLAGHHNAFVTRGARRASHFVSKFIAEIRGSVSIYPETNTKKAVHPSVHQNESTNPAHAHEELQLELVESTLELLFHTEYHALVEYVECAVPILFSVYLTILCQLPAHKYYPHTRNMEPGQLESMLENLSVYVALEVLSFVVMQFALKRKFMLSALYQLAFVLETHVVQLQSRIHGLVLLHGRVGLLQRPVRVPGHQPTSRGPAQRLCHVLGERALPGQVDAPTARTQAVCAGPASCQAACSTHTQPPGSTRLGGAGPHPAAHLRVQLRPALHRERGERPVRGGHVQDLLPETGLLPQQQHHDDQCARDRRPQQVPVRGGEVRVESQPAAESVSGQTIWYSPAEAGGPESRQVRPRCVHAAPEDSGRLEDRFGTVHETMTTLDSIDDSNVFCWLAKVSVVSAGFAASLGAPAPSRKTTG
ncbi:hypothetical protein ON010_g10366 [Phytophthora cinnamomi]|nr:hypothetical protein ON010_g10366 [Phytophthora cinnamomi]